MRAFASSLTLHVAIGLAIAIAGCKPPQSPNAAPAVARGGEAQAVREARAAQNRAIAQWDVDRIAEYWTEDVEIRRGLGTLIVGRDAYRKLFTPGSSFDSAVVYQREPSTITVSEHWPLAYESGTWAGHRGNATGAAIIGGSYAAQWVKRDGRWLIRGEVYVALTCAAEGCAFASVP